MKLAKVRIENFRCLGTQDMPLELDFTDALGRVRDFTLLVGPNASGKTTILDAIAAALGPGLWMPTLRQGFKLSPRTVVQHGALHAKVACWLRFSPEEIAATIEIFQLAQIHDKIPDAPEVKLTWTYPSPSKPLNLVPSVTAYSNQNGQLIQFSADAPTWQYGYATNLIRYETQPDRGLIASEPEMGWLLLRGRDQLAKLLATGLADWNWFYRIGGAFTFDQERTGLGKTISRQVWNMIHGTSDAAQNNEELQTTDPRTILIDLALQSLVPPLGPKCQMRDDFGPIKEKYSQVCAPHRIVGAVRDELGEFDVHFSDGENEYNYDGLSSGEKNVLLLLIRFQAERMHRSLVLIDELELNQHPLWQRALVHMVPRMGEGNQIIATTHSPYLRGAVAPEAVIDLGALDEIHHAGA
jgi:predicted ATPase